MHTRVGGCRPGRPCGKTPGAALICNSGFLGVCVAARLFAAAQGLVPPFWRPTRTCHYAFTLRQKEAVLTVLMLAIRFGGHASGPPHAVGAGADTDADTDAGTDAGTDARTGDAAVVAAAAVAVAAAGHQRLVRFFLPTELWYHIVSMLRIVDLGAPLPHAPHLRIT